MMRVFLAAYCSARLLAPSLFHAIRNCRCSCRHFQRLSASSSSIAEYEEDGREAFLHWAKNNAVPLRSLDPNDNNEDDLKAIAAAVGDSQVVALSEGFHNCQQMMSLHHRIIKYLVEHHGYDTIVTETGLPESRIIHDYVLGKHILEDDSGLERMYKQGLNKMYSEWTEGRALVEWMREYNKIHNNALHYYGSDIGGFYQDWRTPFVRILDYLKEVDAPFAEQVAASLRSYLDTMRHNARVRYSENLTRRERAELEFLLDELLEAMDCKREMYISQSSETEFEWSRQCVESMRLAENYYRNYLNQCHPETSKFVGLDGREIAMCRNVLWAMEQRRRHGASGKVIVVHHVVHTKTESQYQEGVWGFFTPAGQLLRQVLQNKLIVIGMVYHHGHYWKNWQMGRLHRVTEQIPAGRDNGLEDTLMKIGVESCFLPWKEAPTGAFPWLASLQSLRENDYFLNIRPREWDACIFLQNASPAIAVDTKVQIQ